MLIVNTRFNNQISKLLSDYMKCDNANLLIQIDYIHVYDKNQKNDPLYFTMYALVCPNIGMKFICDIGHI